MKHRIFSLLLALSFLSFAPQPVHAFTTVTCWNCSTIMQQIPEFVEAAITSANTYATSFNTFKTMYSDVIMRPIQNALIANALLAQQSNTMNLITGALGGPSFLQGNPEEWIKNQGLNIVKLSLNDIQGTGGIYSQSLLSSIVNSYRTGSDLKTTLTSLSQSSIPTVIQTNVCRDAMLTEAAKNDVMRADGTYDASAFAARKQELYSQLCLGNPLTNQALGRALNTLAMERPDIAGPEVFLERISGENEYARSVRASLAIAAKEEERKNTARDDLNRGGGVVSATECRDDASQGEANIANLPCRNQVVTNTSSALNSALQQALNTPAQKLIAAEGDSIFNTLQSLLAARNTTDLLKNAFGSSGSSSGSSGSSDLGDFLNNPAAREAVTAPIGDLLDLYASTLTKLETTDQKLLVEIEEGEALVETVRSCYRGLERDGISGSTSSADTYTTSRMTMLAGLRALISQDQIDITAARAAITETRTRIQTATTPQAVQTEIDAYQERVQAGEFPDQDTVSARERSLMELNGDNMVDNLEGGTAFSLKQQCQMIRTQWLTSQGAGM